MAHDKRTTQSDSVKDRSESTGSRTGSVREPGAQQGRDRERAIQTGREGAQERGGTLSRRPSSSLAYGSGAATPFSIMRRMMDDMDRLFENFALGRGLGISPWSGFGRDPWADAPESMPGAWTPQVETFRRGDKIVVRADLPGLKKEDVNVEVDDGMLTITGERRDEREDTRDGYYRSERSYGQFYRAIPLPDGVDAEQCNATFNDGVLEVTLAAPKESQQQRRRIEVG